PLAIPMLSSRSPCHPLPLLILFFLNAPAPTDIYTLSLHDALPIYWYSRRPAPGRRAPLPHGRGEVRARGAGCSGGGPAPSSTARRRAPVRRAARAARRAALHRQPLERRAASVRRAAERARDAP